MPNTFNGAYTRSNLFRQLVDMTLPRIRFSSMCTPKDFTVKTCIIGNWSIDGVGFAVEFTNLYLEPISRNCVFDIRKL